MPDRTSVKPVVALKSVLEKQFDALERLADDGYRNAKFARYSDSGPWVTILNEIRATRRWWAEESIGLLRGDSEEGTQTGSESFDGGPFAPGSR